MFNFTQEDLQAAADQLEAAIKAGVAETFADFYMAQDKRGNWYQCPALVCAVRVNPELAEIVRTKPLVRLLDILTAEQSNQIEEIQANFAYEFTRDNNKSYTYMFDYSPQLILNWLRQKIAEMEASKDAIQFEREACAKAVAQFEGSEKMVAAIRARELVAQDFVGKWIQLADGAWECTEVNYLGDLTLRRHGLNYEDEKVTQTTSISLFQLCLPSEHHLFARMIR